jgi:hypothetical protein
MDSISRLTNENKQMKDKIDEQGSTVGRVGSY